MECAGVCGHNLQHGHAVRAAAIACHIKPPRVKQRLVADEEKGEG